MTDPTAPGGPAGAGLPGGLPPDHQPGIPTGPGPDAIPGAPPDGGFGKPGRGGVWPEPQPEGQPRPPSEGPDSDVAPDGDRILEDIKEGTR
ncbi:hypothetical protein [Rhodomicrobium lacus]|uniref:hypothetical protein n=1 Tax=Rhodomicrobium lacus TaxID=2498452 RepID=UPI000F8CFB06|nr:hypothetical protein [Rhodomicrobium lacus]